MERRLWPIILGLLPERQPRTGRFTYDDRVILMAGLWAILHDRPFAWACDPAHWPGRWRPDRLPHPSTLSRRWRRGDLRERAEAVHHAAVDRLRVATRYAALAGRPLVVGGASKDPDAPAGRAVGGFARGYKLHAAVAAGVVVRFLVTALPVSEKRAARRLIERLPAGLTHLVGDANYDSGPLHAHAATHGRRLYTPILGGRVGRRDQPRRRQLLRLGRRVVGRRLLRGRAAIERVFGRMSNLGCGFKGLPPWARRQHRGERWVWGKILIYHAWLLDTRTPE